jgi:hypothetical protein
MLEISLSQDPAIEGVGSLLVRGMILDDLKCVGGVASFRFRITDFFGRAVIAALYHDGYDPPSIGLKSNHSYFTVGSAYFDGTRLGLRFHYKISNPNVVTLYTASPERLYKVTKTTYTNLDSQLPGFKGKQIISDVNLQSSSDKFVLSHGSNYDLGRLGAEVAYTIAKEILSLKDTVLNEPSQGGRDLFTKDGKVVIQARLLARTKYESTEDLSRDLRRELAKLVRKIDQDFRFNSAASVGYAILSYVQKPEVLRSVILQVARSSPMGARERWARPDLNWRPFPPALAGTGVSGSTV